MLLYQFKMIFHINSMYNILMRHHHKFSFYLGKAYQIAYEKLIDVILCNQKSLHTRGYHEIYFFSRFYMTQSSPSFICNLIDLLHTDRFDKSDWFCVYHSINKLYILQSNDNAKGITMKWQWICFVLSTELLDTSIILLILGLRNRVNDWRNHFLDHHNVEC